MTRLDRYVLREALLPFMAGVVGFVGRHPDQYHHQQYLRHPDPERLGLGDPAVAVLPRADRDDLCPPRRLHARDLAAGRAHGSRQRAGAVAAGRRLAPRIFRPLLWAGLLVSLLALLNSEYLAPKFRTKAARLLIDHSLMGPGSAVKPDCRSGRRRFLCPCRAGRPAARGDVLRADSTSSAKAARSRPCAPKKPSSARVGGSCATGSGTRSTPPATCSAAPRSKASRSSSPPTWPRSGKT